MEERRGSFIFIPLLFALIIPLILMFIVNINVIRTGLKLMFLNGNLENFTTIFISIILEAFPFIIIGVFISSLIQMFISEELISRIIPKNKLIGIFIAASIGLIFPVCDCAIVPIARRLLKKGVPLYICVTFMLSVPILNPVVLISTYYAFLNNPYMPILRGSIGFICAALIGLIISKSEEKKSRQASSIKKVLYKERIYHRENRINVKHKHKIHEDECCHHHHHHHDKEKGGLLLLPIHILEHTSEELQEVGKFVIIGAFLSALMQTIVPRNYIISVGHDKVLSVLVMIGLAYLLCVCSETDAFIAKTFVGQFTNGSIIAFLIFGPMVDIKNTLMLSEAFSGKFILKLISMIIVMCLFIGILFNFMGFSI